MSLENCAHTVRPNESHQVPSDADRKQIGSQTEQLLEETLLSSGPVCHRRWMKATCDGESVLSEKQRLGEQLLPCGATPPTPADRGCSSTCQLQSARPSLAEPEVPRTRCHARVFDSQATIQSIFQRWKMDYVSFPRSISGPVTGTRRRGGALLLRNHTSLWINRSSVTLHLQDGTTLITGGREHAHVPQASGFMTGLEPRRVRCPLTLVL
ncbi:unnamed protein product [Pleuronectes platessa]|uniref:Uncharacterized protein n=1 Tax=Pleuronectes platessa TaxID=8262 RepID=A0A9N7VWX7_PLEPL|nr:unnamed protein product [Pleuronectes platessa]